MLASVYIGNGSLLAFVMHAWLKGNHSASQSFSSQLSKSLWPCVVLHGGLILACKPCLNIIIILTLLLISTQWIWWHTREAELRYRHTDVKGKLNWNSENSPMNQIFWTQSEVVMKKDYRYLIIIFFKHHFICLKNLIIANCLSRHGK